MRYGRFALHLTKRIPAVLLVVGIALPMPDVALVVSTKTNRITTSTFKFATQAASGQAPPCTASPSSAALTIPSPISIAPGASNGKIGSPASVTLSIDCQPPFLVTSNYYDNFTVLAGQFAALDTASAPPGGQGIMFQTNVPGIDVLLTATPTQASSGPNGPNGGAGWALGVVKCDSGRRIYCKPNPISATFTAQLVKTGAVSPGTISSIQLLQLFDSDQVPADPFGGTITTYPFASASYGTLTLNAVAVSMAACNVNMASPNFTVTLPTISSSAFQGIGTVAGMTPFSLTYTCPAGWALSMYMSTATPGSAPGVILSTSTGSCASSATNVGVQLLQQDQVTPVIFNTSQPIGVGPSTNGPLQVVYHAQYYQTAPSPVGAGKVCGTATYTMTYQ